MKIIKNRIEREKLTLNRMIELYCRINHSGNNNLCNVCEELIYYAEKSLDNCPYELDKPACNNCLIHCYKKDMREKIRIVMRFSGPKMLFKHPFLAIMHLFDEKVKKNGMQFQKERNNN